mmetsp:Transcript_39462/g.124209  ORF Transcript_39462/g.124209 Transcript_39462/m.124209 type:complete len:86 (-) Transcript_39462:382-639(-)
MLPVDSTMRHTMELWEYEMKKQRCPINDSTLALSLSAVFLLQTQNQLADRACCCICLSINKVAGMMKRGLSSSSMCLNKFHLSHD